MAAAEPEKVILASLVVTGGVVTWKGLRTGTITPRTYASLAVVAFLLLALGTFAPELAAAFAILVLVVVLLASQEDIQSFASFGKGKTSG